MLDYNDLLKYRRMDLGLQQKDVARILNCAANTVSNSEKPYRESDVLVSVSYIKNSVSISVRPPRTGPIWKASS